MVQALMPEDKNNSQENVAIDIAKFFFAVLVIGIHTEPFSLNVWVDRAFGIVTRLCVPFFFTVSAYYLFHTGMKPGKYLTKILKLYVVWSLIYLPFSWKSIVNASFFQNIARFFWTGNGYALWYLLGTAIATCTVLLLSKCSMTDQSLLSSHRLCCS